MGVFTVIGIITVILIALAIISNFIPFSMYDVVESIKDFTMVPHSKDGEGQWKITVQDWNDVWQKKHGRADNSAVITLFEFKQKYIWSKKKEWIMPAGCGCGTADLKMLERLVYDWLENHPKAIIENTSTLIVLKNKAERIKESQDGLIEEEKKSTIRLVDFADRIKVYQTIIDTSTNDRFKDELNKRIEDLRKKIGLLRESIPNMAKQISMYNIDIALAEDEKAN